MGTPTIQKFKFLNVGIGLFVLHLQKFCLTLLVFEEIMNTFSKENMLTGRFPEDFSKSGYVSFSLCTYKV